MSRQHEPEPTPTEVTVEEPEREEVPNRNRGIQPMGISLERILEGQDAEWWEQNRDWCLRHLNNGGARPAHVENTGGVRSAHVEQPTGASPRVCGGTSTAATTTSPSTTSPRRSPTDSGMA